MLVTDSFSASFEVTYRLTSVQTDAKLAHWNCTEVGWSSVPVAKPICVSLLECPSENTRWTWEGDERPLASSQLSCRGAPPSHHARPSSLPPLLPPLSSCSLVRQHFPRLQCRPKKHACTQSAKSYSTKLQSALVCKSKQDACNWPNHSHTEKQHWWGWRL